MTIPRMRSIDSMRAREAVGSVPTFSCGAGAGCSAPSRWTSAFVLLVLDNTSEHVEIPVSEDYYQHGRDLRARTTMMRQVDQCVDCLMARPQRR